MRTKIHSEICPKQQINTHNIIYTLGGNHEKPSENIKEKTDREFFVGPFVKKEITYVGLNKDL